MNHKTALNIIEISEKLAPERIELLPAGKIVGRDGRTWINDHPELILSYFRKLNLHLPIDIEHSTELKAPQGDPSPAVGWVLELYIDGGGVWGRVEWNQIGIDLVTSNQYRYLSPVILYKPGENHIVGITSVALTNKPNLNLSALNARQTILIPPQQTTGQGTSWEEDRLICEKMGLSEAEYLKSVNSGSTHQSNDQNRLGKRALTVDEQKMCRLLNLPEETFY